MKKVTKKELEERIEILRGMLKSEWKDLKEFEDFYGMESNAAEVQRARWASLYDALKILEGGR